MAKTAVALYQTLNDARHVVEELATSGYSRDDIQVIDHVDGSNEAMLRDAGLPQEDAAAYSTGLQHGNHLVMLTASDDMIDAAVYIMESYNALNAHDQQTINAGGYSTNPVFDRDALHDGENMTELPRVEESLRN